MNSLVSSSTEISNNVYSTKWARHCSFNKQLTAALATILIFLFSGPVDAKFCDSSFSRYDLIVEDPDHSHPVFQENRWRCVRLGSGGKTYLNDFGSFDKATGLCESEAPSTYTTDSEAYELILLWAEGTKDLLQHIKEQGHEHAACIETFARDLGSVSTEHIDRHHVGINLLDYFYYSGSIEDQTIENATFIPWSVKSNSATLSMEYLPEFETARCNDPLCGDGASQQLQTNATPITTSSGILEYELPLFDDKFPGLLPLSMHYSSTSAFRPLVNLDRNVNSYQFRSWHHSYDKNLSFKTVNSDSGLIVITIITPYENRLVFEPSGQGGWHNVSHSGVETRIRRIDSDTFEAYRPDGYTERYQNSALTKITYPDGRIITLKRDFHRGSPRVQIMQESPKKGLVIYQDFTGTIHSIEDLYDPSFKYSFKYRYDKINRPMMTSIIRPDNGRIKFKHHRPSVPIEDTRQLRWLSVFVDRITLGGETLLDVNYDGTGRAKRVEFANGYVYKARYGAGNKSISWNGPFGAQYNVSMKTGVNNAESAVYGKITQPVVNKIRCTNCGHSTQASYDGKGLLRSLDYSGALPVSQSYSDGLLTRFSAGTDISASLQWDTKNQLLSQLNTYSGLGYTFDYSHNYVSKITVAGENDTRTLKTPRAKDGTVSSLSGLGEGVFSYDYNGRSFLKGIENGVGHTYTFSDHNHFGLAESITTPNGQKYQLDYDVMGRLTQIRAGTNAIFDASYDALGRTEQYSYLGDRYQIAYNTNKRVSSITGTNGTSVSYGYNSDGLLTTQTYADGSTSVTSRFDFNPEGRLLELSTAYTGGTESTQFNLLGNITQYSHGDNSASYDYDDNGRLQGITQNGLKTVFNRDRHGRLSSLVSPGGRTTLFSYTDFGENTKQENANWGFRSYDYNSVGNLTQATTPLRSEVYDYDKANRLTQETFTSTDNTQPALTTTYFYDEAQSANSIGRLSRVTNDVSRYRFDYNSWGDIIETAIQFDNQVSLSDRKLGYTYDENRRLKQLRYPNGTTIDYIRDTQGRVSEIRHNDSIVIQQNHTAGGQFPTTIKYESGLITERQFDDQGRTERVVLADNSDEQGITLWRQDYRYNSAQNIDRILTSGNTNGNGTEEFKYDSAQRLIEEQRNGTTLYTYDYNTLSNRLSTSNNGDTITYRYISGTDRLSALLNNDGSVLSHYDYDNDGNVTRADNQQFIYDAAGRMTRVEQNGQTIARYSYDSRGRRIEKHTDSGSIFFIYDHRDRLLEEQDTQGNTLRQYIYSDSNELLALYLGTTQSLYFVHSDHQGTPRLITDEQQQVVWSAEKNAFGITTITTAKIDFPIRVSNQYYDHETGLHYNQQRYYDPKIGRYLRNDPIGLEGGHNPYNYAFSNPLKYVDWDGREPSEANAQKDERFNSLVNKARGQLKADMKHFNSSEAGANSLSGTSLGFYIYYNQKTGQYSISGVLPFPADTTHGNFVDPKGFFGGSSTGGEPPHPRTGRVSSFFFGRETVVSKVVRQFEYGYDRSRTYQNWSNKIQGPVYVDHRVGGGSEIFYPK